MNHKITMCSDDKCSLRGRCIRFNERSQSFLKHGTDPKGRHFCNHLLNEEDLNRNIMARTVLPESINSNKFILVPCDKEFKFRGICPYCKGDLTYHAEGWEMDDDGSWMADAITSECSTEPDMESDEWDEWMTQHSDMPYVNQLPVDEAVKRFINSKYRFIMD